eukprot:CAMPEP_0206043026 /NCGR_PEP_ID=MMETSP1466-20131121/7405_1 /ASSEMBLY_ACC=CAM_ASM_001126 /TAXON_ID=44452 /ORGANISM="Pavlova gyrans, Strain CCMP608" /LENGTH=49 /DNA_ID= /DNA_START= /DNA_END= /DNA_ORIENTATION=
MVAPSMLAFCLARADCIAAGVSRPPFALASHCPQEDASTPLQDDAVARA